jgi:hypothetical protein
MIRVYRSMDQYIRRQQIVKHEVGAEPIMLPTC